MELKNIEITNTGSYKNRQSWDGLANFQYYDGSVNDFTPTILKPIKFNSGIKLLFAVSDDGKVYALNLTTFKTQTPYFKKVISRSDSLHISSFLDQKGRPSEILISSDYAYILMQETHYAIALDGFISEDSNRIVVDAYNATIPNLSEDTYSVAKLDYGEQKLTGVITARPYSEIGGKGKKLKYQHTLKNQSAVFIPTNNCDTKYGVDIYIDNKLHTNYYGFTGIVRDATNPGDYYILGSKETLESLKEKSIAFIETNNNVFTAKLSSVIIDAPQNEKQANQWGGSAANNTVLKQLFPQLQIHQSMLLIDYFIKGTPSDYVSSDELITSPHYIGDSSLSAPQKIWRLETFSLLPDLNSRSSSIAVMQLATVDDPTFGGTYEYLQAGDYFLFYLADNQLLAGKIISALEDTSSEHQQLYNYNQVSTAGKIVFPQPYTKSDSASVSFSEIYYVEVFGLPKKSYQNYEIVGAYLLSKAHGSNETELPVVKPVLMFDLNDPVKMDQSYNGTTSICHKLHGDTNWADLKEITVNYTFKNGAVYDTSDPNFTGISIVYNKPNISTVLNAPAGLELIFNDSRIVGWGRNADALYNGDWNRYYTPVFTSKPYTYGYELPINDTEFVGTFSVKPVISNNKIYFANGSTVKVTNLKLEYDVSNTFSFTGNIIALAPFMSTVLVFTTEGIFSLDGNKIDDTVIISNESVVSYNNNYSVVFIADNNIIEISKDPRGTNSFNKKVLTVGWQNTGLTFFNLAVAKNKVYASSNQGIYVFWLDKVSIYNVKASYVFAVDDEIYFIIDNYLGKFTYGIVDRPDINRDASNVADMYTYSPGLGTMNYDRNTGVWTPGTDYALTATNIYTHYSDSSAYDIVGAVILNPDVDLNEYETIDNLFVVQKPSDTSLEVKFIEEYLKEPTGIKGIQIQAFKDNLDLPQGTEDFIGGKRSAITHKVKAGTKRSTFYNAKLTLEKDAEILAIKFTERKDAV